MLTKNYMYLQWGPELLRLYCRFDSYRRRSFLAVMKIVSLPLFFIQNCNFSDKFVSETKMSNWSTEKTKRAPRTKSIQAPNGDN